MVWNCGEKVDPTDVTLEVRVPFRTVATLNHCKVVRVPQGSTRQIRLLWVHNFGGANNRAENEDPVMPARISYHGTQLISELEQGRIIGGVSARGTTEKELRCQKNLESGVASIEVWSLERCLERAIHHSQATSKIRFDAAQARVHTNAVLLVDVVHVRAKVSVVTGLDWEAATQERGASHSSAQCM